jgi:molybdenum cofactor cytidylyltransferase
MVSAVLLGAGESKRMGRNKLSLPWGRKTVFEHSLGTLLQSHVREVVVVLRGLNDSPGWKERQRRGRTIKVVKNPYYRRGMSTSIRRGLQAIDSRVRGILIALGDQPLIKARTINALIHAFDRRSGTIVIPSFRGKKGHPVIFDRRYVDELLKLKGDAGGRSIIEKYPEEVWLVRVRSEGVIKDIDTWKEYRKSVNR